MSHLPDLPSGSTVVMCGHGERAMSAASLLERSGRADLAVLDGGPDDWTRATGRGLESTR
jgi:hydroxyacylglutathione hydrolase